MSNLKNPPAYNPEREGDDYASWKTDVEVWQMVSTLDKAKQGPALYLSLEGSARDKVRGIDKTILNSDEGVKEILRMLDEVYLKDQSTRAYCAFRDFVEYRRKSGQDFATFHVQFENLYREVEIHEMKLPTGAVAYFLLQAANLPEDNERLARVTSEMKYDTMKVQIQIVFGEAQSDGEVMPVKLEEVNYNKFYAQKGRQGGQRYNSNRARTMRTNPVGQDGRTMTCHVCRSTMPFASQCPHDKRRGQDSKDVYFLTESTVVDVALVTEDATGQLMGSTIGYGVLDTACTRTVTGEKWLSEFVSTLTEEEAGMIEKSRKVSNAIFKFGDGVEQKSKGQVVIPTLIGNRKVNIEVDVVECDIPLLIGKPSMKRLKMVIDFVNNKATALGQIIKLRTTKSGHYCIPLSCYVDSCNIVIDSTGLLGTTKEEKKKRAKKLHRQLCHASFDRLKTLLRQSGCEDKEFYRIVQETCADCFFCNKYKKPFPKPIVGFSETHFENFTSSTKISFRSQKFIIAS